MSGFSRGGGAQNTGAAFDSRGMKRRRGVKMAFLLVGLCGGLAGVAGSYERLSGLLESVGAKIPFATIESPGAIGGDAAFSPEVMIAGLQLPGGQRGASSDNAKKKSTPELVIFGPGGNGPDVDPSRLTRARDQRPAVKQSTLVVVHETDEP